MLDLTRYRSLSLVFPVEGVVSMEGEEAPAGYEGAACVYMQCRGDMIHLLVKKVPCVAFQVGWLQVSAGVPKHKEISTDCPLPEKGGLCCG